MPSIFSDNTIEKRVMSVIKGKIRDAQANYELGVKEIEEKAEQEKEVLADKLVEALIGKAL